MAAELAEILPDAAVETERSRDALVAIRQIIKATEFNARHLARDTGLTNSQLIVLRMLGSSGEVTPGAVASSVGLTQATVTTLTDRLVAKGLVSRTRGESDRRKVWLSLTGEGRALLRSLPRDIQNAFEMQFLSLPRWKQAMLVSSLEEVVDMLGASQIEAGPVLQPGEVPAVSGDV